MSTPTVFSQIIKAIPRTEYESWVNRYEGDRGVRSLDCWTWFGALLFGQLTGHDSIRAIERVFAHGDKQMKKLGFGPVRRSMLADANRTRPIEILESAYQYVLGRAQKYGPKKTGLGLAGNVFAMDSTTIELCLSLCPWARCRNDSSRGAAKLHTAIDIAGQLPQFAVITEGRVHDSRVAIRRDVWQQQFKKGDTIVFDRAYIDFGWMSDLDEAGIWFVTRAKRNIRFKVAKSYPTDRTQGHICDQKIYFTGLCGTRRYDGGALRRISYRDPGTGKRLVFLTNRFDVSTQTICDLYKARWKVELFFRTMKSHLRIRKFLGMSYHAVKAQILVALIAYLLVQIFRFTNNTKISIPDAMAVISVLLLLKQPLSELFADLPRVIRHHPSDQLVLNL